MTSDGGSVDDSYRTTVPIDARVLSDVVSANADAALFADLGCGDGCVTFLTATRIAKARFVAVDIRRSACVEALDNARRLGLSGRVQVVQADVLQCTWNDETVLFSNPPMIPGEIGWQHRDAPPFWVRLVEHFVSSGGRELFLHLFEFHGIWTSTGRWPALAECLPKLGLGFECMYRGARPVTERSQIRANLPVLAAHFPKGVILLDGRAVELQSLSVLDSTSAVPLEVEHAVFRIRRN